MREWEIGAVENIHGALPYIRFAPILALVGVGLNQIGKEISCARENSIPILRVEPEELVPDFVLNKLHYLYEKHKPHKKGQH